MRRTVAKPNRARGLSRSGEGSSTPPASEPTPRNQPCQRRLRVRGRDQGLDGLAGRLDHCVDFLRVQPYPEGSWTSPQCVAGERCERLAVDGPPSHHRTVTWIWRL